MAFDVGAVVAHVKADITDFKSGMEKAQNTVSDFSSKTKEGLTQIRNVATIASAALTGIGIAALNFGETAGQYESIRDSFQAMTKGLVSDVDVFENRVADASAGTLDKLTILRGGTRALSLIGKESFNDFGSDFEQMAMLSKKAARATGQDVNFMFDSLILGVSRSSKMILDNLGINISMEESYDNFAKAAGKTSSELTIQEQKAAVLQATIAALQKNYGDVAVTSGGFQGAMQKLNTEWTNFRIEVGTAILPLLNDLVRALIPLIQELMPPLISFLKQVVAWFRGLSPEMQKVIAIFIAIIPVIAAVAAAILILLPVLAFLFSPLGALVIAVQALAAAWLANFGGMRDYTVEVFEFYKKYLTAALEFIKNIFTFYINLFTAIWKAGLFLINTNWQEVWQMILNILRNAWNSVMSLLSNGLNGIKNWAGNVLRALVQPFEDAWHKIQDLVNKIKDALDFTKRHSPSVVDIVNRGVKLVNRAMDDLDLGINSVGTVRPQFAGIPGGGGTIANISIDMAGAFIGDELSAKRFAETMGDSIISKLKSQVRI